MCCSYRNHALFLLVQLYPYFRQKKTTINSQRHCQAQLDVDTITHVWANKKNTERAPKLCCLRLHFPPSFLLTPNV